MPTLGQVPQLNEEIELKFAVSQRDARRLRERPPLKHARRSKASSQRLVSVYFDTPDLDLRHRGIGLRVRHVNGRRLQTVKCDGEAGSPFGRFECEHEIAHDRPDLTCVEAAGLQGLFAEIDAPTRLEPLFTTEVDRTAWELREDGATIECVLDIGEIRAGDKELPIREVELELKSGGADALFDAATALARDSSLRVEWESKGQRGYALAAGLVPQPVSLAAPRLSRKMTVRQAFAAVVGGCIRQIAANEPSIRTQDCVEGVHKMRVGVRRLRAALSTFRDALEEARPTFEDDLRWLQDLLGRARDWDVFRRSTLAPLETETAARGEIRAVVAATEALRRTAYADLRAGLDSPRYTALWIEMGKWLHGLSEGDRHRNGAAAGEGKSNQPIRRYAVDALRQRSKKVRKRGRHMAEADDRELHRLRIQLKKLRYAADFFHGLFSRKQMRKSLARLAGLQEVLGNLNDANTARLLLGRLQASSPSGVPEAAFARGEGVIEGWILARKLACRDRVMGEWRSYKKIAQPWQ